MMHVASTKAKTTAEVETTAEAATVAEAANLMSTMSGIVTPSFKGQSRLHLIHAPKKTTYIITECIEINVTT